MQQANRFLIQFFGAMALCAVVLTSYFLWRARGEPQTLGGNKPHASIPVLTAEVTLQDTPVYLSGLGSVSAFYTVTVRSRVDGRIERVLFREGQTVRRGDPLVQIDPRPFEIALHAAQASLARDTATLTNNQLNMERNKQLLAQNLISAQTVTDLQASVAQLTGTVMADAAAVDSAKLQLEWSHITAPIAGRTGLRLTDPGNLVHANDANGLVVITQLDPIAVLFTLPEDNLPQIIPEMAQGTLEVKAFSRDGTVNLGSGTLSLIDNQINAATGTIRLKAVFANPQHTLWPNQFVRVQLHVKTLRNATVLPAAALQRGPQGDFVYAVTPEDLARATPVQVQMLQNEHAVLAPGLAAGTAVVVDGQYKLRDGAMVAPSRQPSPALPGSAN